MANQSHTATIIQFPKRRIVRTKDQQSSDPVIQALMDCRSVADIEALICELAPEAAKGEERQYPQRSREKRTLIGCALAPSFTQRRQCLLQLSPKSDRTLARKNYSALRSQRLTPRGQIPRSKHRM